MNSVNLDYTKIYALLTAGWLDISAYVVSSISGFWGIAGNEITDRVASTGEMKFILNNADNIFTPDMPTTLIGWQTGTKIKLVVSYDGVEKTKFIGKISGIDIDSAPFGNQQAQVTVLDWMNIPAITQFTMPSVLTNKTMNDGVASLLTRVSVLPSEVDYDTTVVSTFPTIFDTTKAKTRMLSEFAKLANSEFGFIYLRHHGATGDVLVTEGRRLRNILPVPTSVPIPTNISNNLELEDGINELTLEDGINPLTLNEVSIMDFSDTYMGATIKNGSRVTNSVTVNIYPRKVDTSLTVVFNQPSPLAIAGNGMLAFRAYYIDTFGNRINATNLQTPAATTDYLAFTLSNGTGTNITANIAVTGTYGGEAVDYLIYNTAGAAGYITKLQARGFGIYPYNTITYAATQPTSIDTNGEIITNVDMKYQDSPAIAEFVGDVILDNYSLNKNTLESIDVIANANSQKMMAFVYGDIGDLIGVSVPKVGISSVFFIQSIKFELTVGGIVSYKFGLTDALSLSGAYWTLDTSALDSTTVVGI